MKEQTLAKTNPVNGAPKRYQPDDELLTFLKTTLITNCRLCRVLNGSCGKQPFILRALNRFVLILAA